MSERTTGWGICWRCGMRVYLWKHECQSKAPIQYEGKREGKPGEVS